MRFLASTTSGNRGAQLQLSFEDFLYSGCMRRQATTAMCEPEDVIYDHLPTFDCGEPEEIREAFAEACEAGSDYTVDKVELDDQDLNFVRRRFIEGRMFRLVPGSMPPAA